MPEKNKNIQFLQGNQACVEAALLSGLKVFAGYPITPSTEILEILAARLPKAGGRFIQMEDEIASMGVILGASIAGCKSMTATSGPGFSLKQELIGYASFCEIPCVIVNVQRGGPSTGLPTCPAQSDVMQARWGTHGDHPAIAFTPSSVQEMFDLTIEAFNASEKYRTPVILLADETVAHMREKVRIRQKDEIKIINRKLPKSHPAGYKPYAVTPENDVPLLANFGTGYRYNITGLYHDETGFPTQDPEKVSALITRLHAKIEDDIEEITFYDEINMEDAEIALISYGSTARSCMEAALSARKEGIKAGCLKLKTIWPFPKAIVAKAVLKCKAVIVCEMNLGQLIGEVMKIDPHKVFGVNIANGKIINPADILDKIKEVCNGL